LRAIAQQPTTKINYDNRRNIMTQYQNSTAQQPEALTELARAAREKNAGETGHDMSTNTEHGPLPTDSVEKHGAAETQLSTGAKGADADSSETGMDEMRDRTQPNK
jgi:hypothetical protein